MENEEDIVGHALNWGIKSAGKRFHVSDTVVKDAVHRFVWPMVKPCQCEEHFQKTGQVVMCFMCIGRDISMTLNQRLAQMGMYIPLH